MLVATYDEHTHASTGLTARLYSENNSACRQQQRATKRCDWSEMTPTLVVAKNCNIIRSPACLHLACDTISPSGRNGSYSLDPQNDSFHQLSFHHFLQRGSAGRFLSESPPSFRSDSSLPTMTGYRATWLYVLSTILATSLSSQSPVVMASPSLSQAVQSISRRGHLTLARSIPALSVYHVPQGSSSSKNKKQPPNPWHQTVEVATTVKKRKKRRLNLPAIDTSQLQTGGFYYGINPQTMSKAATKDESKRKPRLSDSMYEALEELRMMRMEMETMRKEMQSLKRKMMADGQMEDDSEEAKTQMRLAKWRRARECEKLAAEVEEWAMKIIKEGEEDGWKEVPCNKMMRGALNPTERTKAYLKWMKDSRGDKADKEDDTEYPCIKCMSIIDAPLEDVCTYLSQESASPDYNDVVAKHKDVEEISPNAKICWSQSPQILFVKPRDFVTFCHHRWKGDGAQVMVNQAIDHPDYPANNQEKEGKPCRAYALRGANIFTRCPDDPEKTIIHIVAHANPGGIPQWAAKTAVNALAPIEPFKLFHKINENVKRNRPQLRERLQQAEMVGSSLPNGRSPRPAGMAQLGYACFWPNGGGVFEGSQRQSKELSDHDSSGEEDMGVRDEGKIESQVPSDFASQGETLAEST